MGQELTTMCACFDCVKELGQEVDMQHLDSMKIVINSENNSDEIEGFAYSDITACFDSIEEQFKALISEGSTGYDVIVDKDNCKVLSKEAPDGYILKYSWNIPYSAEKFKDFMSKPEMRKTWDGNVETNQVVGRYRETESIMYTKYKKFLTFDPRETLAYTKTIQLFGNIADITYSVESEKFPVQNGVVRVKLYVAGMYIEKIDPDESGNITRVTCLSHMDIGLPKNLNNIARKFAGTTIPPITKKIVTQLKKYVESQQ